MVHRRNRRDGNPFWGCPSFPRCRGTRDIASDTSVGQREKADTPAQIRVLWNDATLDRTGWRGYTTAGGRLSPNPPKDTDGRREDRRRGMRELQRKWPGLDRGRWEVGGAVTAQAPNGRLWELGCAGWQENRQQGTPADLVGASWRGRWVSGGGRRQAGSGMARSRARARLNWVSQGQRCGRCRVRRRAERVRRPARAKTRRLRVLVVTIRAKASGMMSRNGRAI